MVETWIDNNDNDFENQDPNFMESNILEADNSYTMNESSGVKTNKPLIRQELHKETTPSKLTSLMGINISLRLGSTVLLCSLI